VTCHSNSAPVDWSHRYMSGEEIIVTGSALSGSGLKPSAG
jgi:hypothetical protein